MGTPYSSHRHTAARQRESARVFVQLLQTSRQVLGSGTVMVMGTWSSRRTFPPLGATRHRGDPRERLHNLLAVVAFGAPRTTGGVPTPVVEIRRRRRRPAGQLSPNSRAAGFPAAGDSCEGRRDPRHPPIGKSVRPFPGRGGFKRHHFQTLEVRITG